MNDNPIVIIAACLFVALTVLALWMLVDCARNEKEQKALWLVLLLVVGFPAAVAYLLVRKIPRDRQARTAARPSESYSAREQPRQENPGYRTGFGPDEDHFARGDSQQR